MRISIFSLLNLPSCISLFPFDCKYLNRKTVTSVTRIDHIQESSFNSTKKSLCKTVSGASLCHTPPGEALVADLAMRAWRLRRRRRIGVVWCDEGRFWISESEIDPYAWRRRISLLELAELIQTVEGAEARKHPARADVIPRSEKTIAS